MNALLVVLGAAVGAPARLLVSRAVAGERGTLVVNVVGSLLIGLFAGLATPSYALLGVGFCGAFTTYSAFAVETATMPPRGAALYVGASVVLCCLACALGLALTG
ncbi:MAG: chromosome condensation protein CrcB [Frankiales bacterium]|jgi:CrcB protein|nr:chromosome condensation protein CrcB [Frankiales bacterium]